MKVQLHSDVGTLEELDMGTTKIKSYVELIKMYGYMDMEGNMFRFNKAFLEPFEVFCIELEKVED